MPTLLAAVEASGQCPNKLAGVFVSRQGGSFILRSSLRLLTGRVVSHPERRPSRALFLTARRQFSWSGTPQTNASLVRC
jgi:hypothetical protein